MAGTCLVIDIILPDMPSMPVRMKIVNSDRYLFVRIRLCNPMVPSEVGT